MSESTKAGIMILVQGYPMTFLVTLGFYFMIKILMKVKIQEEEK